MSGLVLRFSEERKRHRNLGMVLGRLVYGSVVILGGLVALTILSREGWPTPCLRWPRAAP